MRFRLAGLAYFVSLTAWAHWTSLTVQGTPRDVNILGPEKFAVMSTSEMAVFTCPYDGGACSDGGMVNLPIPIGASMTSSGCVWRVDAVGNVSGCGLSGKIAVSNSARRLRCIDTGFCALSGAAAAANQLFYASGPSDGGDWSQISSGFLGSFISNQTPVLSGLTVSNVNYLLHVAPGQVAINLDGGSTFIVPLPAVGFGGVDGTLFLHPDGGIGVLLAVPDTVPQGSERELYGADLTISGGLADAGFRTTPMQFENPIGGLKRLAYTESQGSEYGFGFGMGTNRDGGLHLASPVPNPNQPAQLWVPRSTKPDGGSNWGAIACDTNRMCVVATLFGDAGNVWVYRNMAPPHLSFSAPLVMTEGDNAGTVEVDAGEDEGDPIWITWVPPSAGPVTITPTDAGPLRPSLAATLTVPSVDNSVGGPCSQAISYSVVASDGYQSHDRWVTPPLTYFRKLSFAVNGPASVPAGGNPIKLVAELQTPCDGKFDWKWSAPALGSIQPNANDPREVDYTPPRNWCSIDAGNVTVTLTAQLDGGKPYGVDAGIRITPWGPPETPQFTGPFTRTSGVPKPFPYSNQLHVCGTSPNFPGGVTVAVGDAGLPPSVTAFADETGVTLNSTDYCFSDTASTSVFTQFDGFKSPAATLSVTFEPNFPPIGPGSNFSMNLSVDAGGSFLSGVFTIDAGCVDKRGLTANLSVKGPSTDLHLDNLAVPGRWSSPVPGSCLGGTLTATADLYESDGGKVATDIQSIAANSRDPGIGEVRPARLYVSCQGINSTLTVLDPPPYKCPLAATKVQWIQTSDAGIATLGSGATVQITSIEPGIDNLIGQTLEFEISSDTGANSAKERRSVKLVTDPFVELSHSISPAGAASEDVVTVTTSVLNRADCSVSNVHLRIEMTGLVPIRDTGRIDGSELQFEGGVAVAPDGGAAIGQALDLGPFRLAPNEKHTVTWLAKVVQLAKPTIKARATVSGTEISLPSSETEAKTTPCGCQTTSSLGWVWMVLLAVGIRNRRHLKA